MKPITPHSELYKEKKRSNKRSLRLRTDINLKHWVWRIGMCVHRPHVEAGKL